MKTFIQDGKTLDVTLSADVASGGMVIQGAIHGIAAKAGISGGTVAVKTDGVFELAKNTSQAFTQGATLYWDAGNGNLTTTATDNTKVGYAAEAAGSSATTGKVKLVETV